MALLFGVCFKIIAINNLKIHSIYLNIEFFTTQKERKQNNNSFERRPFVETRETINVPTKGLKLCL